MAKSTIGIAHILLYYLLLATVSMTSKQTRRLKDHMFIVTSSAERIDFSNLSSARIHLSDIAHALSWVNRFTGHARFGFSVASHSLAVSYFLESRGASAAVQMGGLMHDAHEAYFGDVATPIKHYLDILPQLRSIGVSEDQIDTLMLGIRAREDAVQDVVAQKLGLDVRTMRHKDVKRADLLALFVERHELLPPDGKDGPWPILQGITHDMCADMPKPVDGLVPAAVAKVFMARFEELRAQMSAENLAV